MKRTQLFLLLVAGSLGLTACQNTESSLTDASSQRSSSAHEHESETDHEHDHDHDHSHAEPVSDFEDEQVQDRELTDW